MAVFGAQAPSAGRGVIANGQLISMRFANRFLIFRDRRRG
jgi:hypothetical protein